MNKDFFECQQELIQELITCDLIKIKNNQIFLTKKGYLNLYNQTLSFQDVCIVPKFNEIDSRLNVDLSTYITKNIKIPSPLIASNMSCVTNGDFIIKLWEHNAVGVFHRFYDNIDNLYSEIKKVSDQGIPAIVSCGVKKESFNIIKQCIKNGAKAIITDIAHGHSKLMIDAAKELKTLFPNIELILGNICTKDAVNDLAPYANGFKVGIGTGSICQTTHKTGAGLGLISSIIDCHEAARKYGIPIISDGGISESSDAMKALVAGASTIMAGKIFARCPESAAPTIEENGRTYKLYWGMASNFHKSQFYKGSKASSEGVASKIPIGANCSEFVPEFLGGLRSGFTYCGASNIEELWEKGVLRQASKASYEKGKPHVLETKGAIKVSS